MGTTHDVLDISSDEELGQEEFGEFEESNLLERKADDLQWLSELMGEEENETDDSDEVMVVGEVNPTKQRLKSKPSNQSLDDLNDDCIILDGDPDKVVAVVNDSADDGNELLVVGEKGQIPCRDYPHSRHLCARFPFSSTPHEEHCALCHCYVCDSVAPCVYWGTGVSTTDHCHATDKGEMWKSKRKEFQLWKIASLQAPKLHDSSTTKIRAQPNNVPSQNIVRLAPNTVSRSTPRLNATMNSRLQNHISESTAIRPCSTSSNFTAPDIILLGRNQRSIVSRKFHPRSFSHHSLGVRNNAIQRDRSLDISKLGSHFVSSSTMCTRKVASRGDLPADQAMPNNTTCSRVSQYIAGPVTVAPPPLIASNAIGPSSWQDVRPNMNTDLYNYQSSSHPNMNNAVMNAMNSHVEVSHQPIFQSNDCENFYQNQNPSMDQNAHQLGGFNQSASPNDILLEAHSESGIFHMESNDQSAGEPTFQLGNQIDNTTGLGSGVNINWVNENNQENGQFLAENSQYQCMGSTDEPFPVKETSFHFTGEFNVNPLHGGSFENWPFENQSVPSVSDCLVPFEPIAIDARMLAFDFQTSWNDLTQT